MSSYTGGTSRRSHTKSRHGCKTCKKRHIRCDETFPQCRNCSKHQVRCDYMETQGGTDTSSSNSPIPSSDLYWNSEVEAVLDRWHRSGYCSLGNNVYSLHSSGYIFSKSDLNLMYQALWSSGPNNTRLSDYTIWSSKVPKFLAAAGDKTYFVHAMLGFGSLSLAWDRGSQDAKNLGYHHGAIALQGVQNAIGAFSQENSDAILASSVLLSWQANDFRAWQSLNSGIRNVVNSMINWRSQSKLQDLIDQLQIQLPSTGGFDTYVQRSHDFQLNYQNVLQSIVLAMNHLQPYCAGRQEAVLIEQFHDYAQRLLGIQPANSPEEQFSHLYALRKWLFWIPSTMLSGSNHDYLTLVFLAHLYAMAVALHPLFPEVAGSLVSAISLAPLQKILVTFEELRQDPHASSASGVDFSTLFSLMLWPQQVVANYETRKLENSYSASLLSSSPVNFDTFSTDLSMATETFNIPQRSPAFAAQPGSRLSMSSSYSSNQGSSGSPFLELPILQSSSPAAAGRSFTTPNLPSMTSGYDANDPLFTESQFDYTAGGRLAPGQPRSRSGLSRQARRESDS